MNDPAAARLPITLNLSILPLSPMSDLSPFRPCTVYPEKCSNPEVRFGLKLEPRHRLLVVPIDHIHFAFPLTCASKAHLCIPHISGHAIVDQRLHARSGHTNVTVPLTRHQEDCSSLAIARLLLDVIILRRGRP